jgi:hypothetical protein
MIDASSAISGSNILWASILGSAAVAAFVTLAIEYLAKPWLEVRKERIQERSRRQRTALHSLISASYKTGQIVALRNEQSSEFFRARTIGIAEEALALIEAALMERATQQINAPASLSDDWSTTSASVSGFLLVVKVKPPNKEAWDMFDTDSDRLGDYADLFSTPGWHWWRRRKLVHKIESSASPRLARDSEPSPP